MLNGQKERCFFWGTSTRMDQTISHVVWCIQFKIKKTHDTHGPRNLHLFRRQQCLELGYHCHLWGQSQIGDDKTEVWDFHKMEYNHVGWFNPHAFRPKSQTRLASKRTFAEDTLNYHLALSPCVFWQYVFSINFWFGLKKSRKPSFFMVFWMVRLLVGFLGCPGPGGKALESSFSMHFVSCELLCMLVKQVNHLFVITCFLVETNQ